MTEKNGGQESQQFSSALEKVPGAAMVELLTENRGEVSRRDFGDRYEFVQVLGEGGQGVVVEAHDSLLEREVAIKVLKKRNDPAHTQMLEREAHVGATLEHPNILPIYDLGADEIDSPILVMRKIEGRSLEELLKELYASAPDGLRRSRWRLLNIFMAVLNAIEFAHSRGILHLDLKPGNVSLGAHGEVYVIDWGFARRKGDASALRPGGTVHYIAPERLDGRDFDERADVFSLGVILYRLLTGRHPRDTGPIPFKQYREVWRDYPLIPARERDRSVAPELSAICQKAMAEDLPARYPSVRAMIDDLERFMSMLPVSAYQESLWGRCRRMIRKHRRGFTASVVVAVMLLVTSYALYNQWDAERRKAQAEREKLALEESERRAEKERNQAMRRRYEARNVLKRADDLLRKSQLAVEGAATPEEKRALLAPVMALIGRAAATDPDYAEVYDMRARVERLGFDWAAALRDYERAYQLDSSYLMALYEAGMLLADVFQQPDAAREKFRMMNAVSPNDEYAELGQAQVDIGEADRLLKLPPSSPKFAQRKELASDLYDQVLARLERIEKVNPALSDVWYLRGLAYQKSPRRASPEKAREAYDRFLAARRDSPSAFHNRGDARKDLGDVDGAIADYTAAIDVSPEFFWSLRNRGYLYYKVKNDVAAALADINRAIAIAPQVAWSYVDRAAVREGTGDYAAANQDYQQALALDPDNPRILYRLAVLRFYQLEFADAEKYFTAAIAGDRDGTNSTALYRRGLARLAQDKHADAICDFEAAIAIRRERQPDGVIYPALMRYLAFLFQGQRLGADDFGRQLEAPADRPWLTAVGSFYMGEATESDVLRLAGDPFGGDEVATYRGTPEDKEKLARAPDLKAICEARFYLGAHCLAVGRLEAAKEHLRVAIDTGVNLYMEHTLSLHYLKRLEKP